MKLDPAVVAALASNPVALASYLATFEGAPAASAPMPAFVQEARAARKARPVKANAPTVTVTPTAAPKATAPKRSSSSWSRDTASDGVSKAGYPFVAYAAMTSRGQSFVVRIPADLLAAIRAGL